MAKRLLLGTDIGTSGCKTLIVNDLGEIEGSATAGYPLLTPHPGWTEQDPELWWRSVKDTIREALKSVGGPEEIEAIGLSGQMHGLVALDRNHGVLRPCIPWNDQRNEKQCREMEEALAGSDSPLALTNNPILTGITSGKVLWMRENEPRLFDRLAFVLNPKDYIRLRLTGEIATEVSDASGTGLYDVKNRAWSHRVMEKIGLSKDVLPKCFESAEVSGSLSPGVAAELGLLPGTPVVGGAGDGVAQAVGTGLARTGILGTTIGTAGVVAMSFDRCCENPGGKLQVVCNADPEKWLAVGVTLSGGGCLGWAKDLLGLSRQDASDGGDHKIYERMSQEAARSKPGADGLIFLPYLAGERCPHSDPRAKGAFIGMTLRHHRSELLRSIFEGVIYSLRDAGELIRGMGFSIDQVRASGGGTMSGLWRQIHADVFNSEVVTVSAGAEGGAFGAALIAGVGAGVWKDIEEAAGVLRIETRTEPIPGNVEVYEELFAVYRGLYEALKGSFGRIADIGPRRA